MTVDDDSIYFGITTEDSSVGIFRYSEDGCSDVWIDSDYSFWTDITYDISYYSENLDYLWGENVTLLENPNSYSVYSKEVVE